MDKLFEQSVLMKSQNKSQQAVYSIRFHYLKKDYGSGYGFLREVNNVCKLEGLEFTFDNIIDEGYVPGCGSFFSTQCIADTKIWKTNSDIEKSVFKVLNDLYMFPARGQYKKVEVEFVEYIQQDNRASDEYETNETSDTIEIVKAQEENNNNNNNSRILQVSNSSSSDETKTPGQSSFERSIVEVKQGQDQQQQQQEQEQQNQLQSLLFFDIKDCQLDSQKKKPYQCTPQSDALMQQQEQQMLAVKEYDSESSTEGKPNSDEGFTDDSQDYEDDSNGSQENEERENKLEEVDEKQEKQVESDQKQESEKSAELSSEDQETKTGEVPEMLNQEKGNKIEKESMKNSESPSSNADSENLQLKALLQESKSVKEKNLQLLKDKQVLEMKVVELIADNSGLASKLEQNSKNRSNSVDQIMVVLLQDQQDKIDKQKQELDSRDAIIQKLTEEKEQLLKEVASMKDQLKDTATTKNNTEKILQLLQEMQENKKQN